MSGGSTILGEAVESLIGAVYLDGVEQGSGLAGARAVLTQMGFFLEEE
jgi:dsRNA-specific ribonuclease